jgi:hypothetical protein
MHDVERARIGTRSKDMAAQAQTRGCKRQHAAELAAAKDADGRSRLEHGPQG